MAAYEVLAVEASFVSPLINPDTMAPSRTWNLAGKVDGVLRERSTVVWLRAKPEDHWNRVVAQGDRRPMADHPAAMDELNALLVARESIYGEARITVDPTDGSPHVLADGIARTLQRP